MDPAINRKILSDKQRELRKMVMREVTDQLQGRGPVSEVEYAFVRAVYSPDKRLTPAA